MYGRKISTGILSSLIKSSIEFGTEDILRTIKLSIKNFAPCWYLGGILLSMVL